MARILAATIAFFLICLAVLVDAAPLQTRQIGNIQCNVARLKIVGALAASGRNIKKIGTADVAAAGAASTASAGIQSANAGVAKIAAAIVTGQKAPAAARDQVEKGLTDAQTALQGLDSTDPAVASSISSVSKAISAGQDVVANCK
ncbi:hypothetical protein HGRIS_000688 [Hohenbuehelia grisea]|uniref:Antifreeze protein n=1 Tax=Hohenbuehelia grisea TaxID=104357 RepID=A0ABR3JRQ9_9AGAR